MTRHFRRDDDLSAAEQREVPVARIAVGALVAVGHGDRDGVEPEHDGGIASALKP